VTLHEQYDPTRWADDRDREKQEGRWWFSTADGPGMCELLARRQQMEMLPLGRKVPADIFVMQPWPPPDRSMTNINGLPYRPASLGWPREYYPDIVLRSEAEWLEEVDPDNEVTLEEKMETLSDVAPALNFLGQFNFADSCDLVGKLPGEVLLLFGDPSMAEVQYYEWQPLGLSNLMTAEQVPVPHYKGAFEPAPCYGQILRTYDYPDARSQDRDDYNIFCWNATRIGGKPHYAQGAGEDLPGRFLCCLYGLPNSDVNLYIHIDDEGQIHSANECS
jgi:hypothetical protein